MFLVPGCGSCEHFTVFSHMGRVISIFRKCMLTLATLDQQICILPVKNGTNYENVSWLSISNHKCEQRNVNDWNSIKAGKTGVCICQTGIRLAKLWNELYNFVKMSYCWLILPGPKKGKTTCQLICGTSVLVHGWPRYWTDFRCIFSPTLTILTPASLRDVKEEEGPAAARIIACTKWRGSVVVVPDVKHTL